MVGLASCPNPTGSLEIVDVLSLHTPAWTIIDSFVPMWFFQTDIGGNDDYPDQAGTDPNPLRPGEADHRLNMLVCGEWSPDGDPWPDPMAGLEFNSNALRFIIDPLATETSERPYRLHMPSGLTRDAACQTRPFRPGVIVRGLDQRTGYKGVLMRAQFSLTIPSGIFEPT